MKRFELSWTKYEHYVFCPKWYNYSHVLQSPESHNYKRIKDIQHLLRGNVTQTIIDEWIANPIQHDPIPWDYLRDRIHSCLQEERIKLPGYLQTTEADLELTIYSFLKPSLLSLRTLLQKRKSFEPQIKNSVDYKEMTLIGIPDLTLINYNDSITLVEGKSTLHPHKAKKSPDQLRWNMQILLDSGFTLAKDHYYLFYSTGEIWPIQTGSIQSDWREMRDYYLQQIMLNNFTATPGSFQCNICPHYGHCPDHFLTRKEKDPPSFKQGHQTFVF